MTPVLRAESIGKRFGRQQVLKAATLYATPGRITVLVGRNACGKSTLLQAIAGVQAFDFGAVHFAGRVHTRPRLHKLARDGLFYLPERGLLSPMLTLRKHVELCGAPVRLQQDTLASFGLTDFLERYPDQLSGGERRRADFLMAALRTPRCLLADEPFLEIAPLDVERLHAIMRNLAAAGSAIVVTGHEVTTLFDIADHVVWLTAGTTHDLGTAASAILHDQFRQEYLGWRRTAASGT